MKKRDNVLSTILSPLLACSIALGAVLASGCSSPGEAKYDQAKMLQKRGMFEEAVQEFQEAATLLQKEGGKPGRAWEKLGTIYKHLGDQKKAIEYFQKSIDADPKKLKRYAKLMRAYTLDQQYDKAREVYDNILKDEELSQLLRFELGDKQELEQTYAAIDIDKAEHERLRAAEEAAKAAAKAAEEEAAKAAAPDEPAKAPAEEAAAPEAAPEAEKAAE